MSRKRYILFTFIILCTGLMTCMTTLLASPLFLTCVIDSYSKFKFVGYGSLVLSILIYAHESKQHQKILSGQIDRINLLAQIVGYYSVSVLFGMIIGDFYVGLNSDGWIILVVFGISLLITTSCALIGLVLPQQRIRYFTIVVWMIILVLACLFVSFILKVPQIKCLLLEGLIVLCCVGAVIQINQLKFSNIRQDQRQCWSDIFWACQLLMLNFLTLVLGIIALIFSSSDDNN